MVLVKVLCSDNTKYLSTPFASLMFSQAITHRLLMHILLNKMESPNVKMDIDTTHTLLIHHHIPILLGQNAILTACYLINRMLFAVLDPQSPYSILFPVQNPHHLPLRCLDVLTLLMITVLEKTNFTLRFD